MQGTILLVEDLLSLSRLETSPSQMRPVNVRAIAKEAISALREAAERAQVTMVLQAPLKGSGDEKGFEISIC